MIKIYQGGLPESINVVIDGKVVTKAVFINGVYETDNKAVVKELKEYGYKVEDIVNKPSPQSSPQRGEGIKVKSLKPKKKKEVD